MQITTGLRSILSHPAVYTTFQRLMGARQGWKRTADQYLQMKPGEVLLDVGCGPADILGYLPAIEYHGFDISPEYIASAASRPRADQSASFYCKLFDDSDLGRVPGCDAALLSGVLHHLDDAEARELVHRIVRALKPGARLVTIDPCYAVPQNPVARTLISLDRGRNVRDEQGYRALLAPSVERLRIDVVHRAWIPYTHCISVGTVA